MLRVVAFDGHCQPEADARHGRVDADHPTARIDQRAAGVAGIEGGVGLDHVLDDASTGRKRPPECAYNPGRHRAGKTERVAYRDDQLPDSEAIGVSELNLRQRRATDAHHGEIRQAVAPDDFELELATVGEAGGTVLDPRHDVRGGDEVAVGGHNDTATGSLAASASDTQRGHGRHDALGNRGHDGRVGVERLLFGELALEKQVGHIRVGPSARTRSTSTRAPRRSSSHSD